MATRLSKLDLTIAAACLAFVVILLLSAWWDPSIRWLHFFQAWLYVATAMLTVRQARWGYFLGIVTGGFWAYGALFLNGFFQAGRAQLMLLLETGTLTHPEAFIAVPAVLANLIIVMYCVWGYLRLGRRRTGDAAIFAASAVVSIGYFVGIVALFQPRYLGMFARVLHPHLRF